jgi:hypothetical protein
MKRSTSRSLTLDTADVAVDNHRCRAQNADGKRRDTRYQPHSGPVQQQAKPLHDRLMEAERTSPRSLARGRAGGRHPSRRHPLAARPAPPTQVAAHLRVRPARNEHFAALSAGPRLVHDPPDHVYVLAEFLRTVLAGDRRWAEGTDYKRPSARVGLHLYQKCQAAVVHLNGRHGDRHSHCFQPRYCRGPGVKPPRDPSSTPPARLSTCARHRAARAAGPRSRY